jgi:outer membrane protein assembly factor BamB
MWLEWCNFITPIDQTSSIMKKIILLLFIVILASYHSGIAQTKTPPSWTAKFKKPINWQRVHSLGYLIVGTSDALYGVNPTDGKILWENKNYPAVNPASYSEIEGTEFVTLSVMTDKSPNFPMQVIIEVVEGKTLFDSQKEEIGVLSRHVLPQSNRLLIIGAKQGALIASLFMYDIVSGKQLWTNSDLFQPDQTSQKGFMGKLQALGQKLASLQSLSSEPLEMKDGTLILTHPSYVIRLNSADGKVLWKNSVEQSKKAQILFSPYKPGVVFVGTEVESDQGSGFSTSSSSGKPNEPAKFFYNVYYAYDVQTGTALWKQPARENDMLNQIIVHEKGLIICPRSTQKPTINLVDYATGKTMWGNKGKGIKAQGSVVNYIETEKGILITTAFDNAWNNKAEEYYLNILDPNTGTLKYEKSVKLKGDLVSTEIVPKGLLFVTTREVNILDTNTGSLLWQNSLEAGGPANGDKVRPFPTGEKGDKLYVFSPKEGGLFEVDKTNGTNKKITPAKIEFAGKELPKAIDVVSDGVVLYSDQNVLKLGFDGLQKFYKYYPAPRQPGLMRALLIAEAVRAAYIGAAASAYSAAFAQAAANSKTESGKQVGTEMSRGFAQLGNAGFAYSSNAMKAFSARFKASQSTPNFLMMMTTQEKKGNQLVQVNKGNGELMNAVDIKNDKDPEYDVDQIYNFIYYRPNATDIVCYKL